MVYQKRKINNYLKLIRKQLLLVYSEEETDNIINMLNEQTHNFITDHPSASIEEIQKYIMDNDQFIKYGLENIDPEIIGSNIDKASRLRKRTKVISIIAVIILGVFVAGGIYNVIYVKEHSIAYYTEEIIDYGDIPSTNETDSTEFSSESSSELTE